MKASKITVYSCAFILILFLSCQQQLDTKDYFFWIENPENELHVIKTSNEFVFDLQYQPYEYLNILGRNSRNLEAKQAGQETQQFLLKISHQDSKNDWIRRGSQKEIQGKLYYFSYLFQEDVYIEENGVVLPCKLYHFEQSQSFGVDKVFLLSFENRFPKSQSATLVINSEYFGSLPIRMKVSKSNIPKLKV